MLKEKMRF